MNALLGKLNGTHITIIILAGMALSAYGLASGRVDALTLGGIVTAFGTWRAPTGGPPSAPAPVTP